MSRSSNVVLGAIVAGVMSVVGVVAVRAIAGPAEASTAESASIVARADVPGQHVGALELADVVDGSAREGVVTAADLIPRPDRLIPVIEPVYVGGGDADIDEVAEMLLDRPLAAGAGAGSEPGTGFVGALPASGAEFAGAVPAFVPLTDVGVATDGGVPPPTPGSEPTTSTTPSTTPPDTDAGAASAVDAGAGPFVLLDPLLGFERIIERIEIDPCAGADPSVPPPPGCPPGEGATLLGLTMPPAPFAFFARGHYLTPSETDSVPCPSSTVPAAGDGQAAMTLFSRTPVESATFQIRPYGSDEAWMSLPGVVASPQSDIDTWNSRLEARDYDIGWGTVAVCFVVDRDPTLAYDIQALVVDTYGNDVVSNRGLIPIVDPDRRPPTTGRVLSLGPVASVDARTLDGGTVTFTHKVVDPDDVGDLNCETGTGWSTSPGSGPFIAPRSTIFPMGIFDPDYSTLYNMRFPMPIAGSLWVCAWIYPTENPLTPLAVDSMLFSAPSAQRPSIILQGIRRLGEQTIEAVTVSASRTGSAAYAGTAGYSDWCGGFETVLDLPPGRPRSVEETIWQCVDQPLDLDTDRSTVVPVRVQRSIDGHLLTEEVAVRIDVDDCGAGSCESRPREWYEVPIPSGDRSLCGTGFGSGGCDVDSAAGIAVIRVDYDLVVGTSDPNGDVVLLDQVDQSVGDGAPRYTPIDFEHTTGPDPFLADATFSFFTDRPMRMGITIESLSDEPCFAGTTELPLTDDFQDSFSFDVAGLCAGETYGLALRGVDEAGGEWDWSARGAYTIPAVARGFDVAVDFRGGPENYGFFYRFGVTAEGQNTTAYWYDITGSQGSADNCYGLAGTRAVSRGYHPPIAYFPNEFTVEVRLEITTNGATDCPGRATTPIAPIEFSASFTVDQIRGDEPLVFESPESSPIDMLVTLTPQGTWRRP